MKDYITPPQFKRTLRLLYDVRMKNGGIDMYLLLKKIFIVGMVVEHYQRERSRYDLIRYEDLLCRNENLVYNFYTKDDEPCLKQAIIRQNGLCQSNFFGISSDFVLKNSLINVRAEIERQFQLTKWL